MSIRTVEDEDTLAEFARYVAADTDYDTLPAIQADRVENYRFIVYRAPVALIHDGQPEELFTLSIYQDSSEALLWVSPDAVHNIRLPEDMLVISISFPQKAMDYLSDLAGNR